MGKSLKLIPIEQVLLSYSPATHEVNKVIGLYNSRNFNNEINIQVIDSSIFITEGEKENIETFVKTELMSIPDFERESGIASGNIETMLSECSKRGDIPSNAYISALTIGGKYYIHKGYLDHFQERFGTFSDFIENTPEEILEEDLGRYSPYSTNNTEETSDTPQKSIDEEDEPDDFEYDDDDEDANQKAKKKKRDAKRREERLRIENENKLAETRRQIAEAQIRATIEEKYKNENIQRRAIEEATRTAAKEFVNKQEFARKEYEKSIANQKQYEEKRREFEKKYNEELSQTVKNLDNTIHTSYSTPNNIPDTPKSYNYDTPSQYSPTPTPYKESPSHTDNKPSYESYKENNYVETYQKPSNSYKDTSADSYNKETHNYQPEKYPSSPSYTETPSYTDNKPSYEPHKANNGYDDKTDTYSQPSPPKRDAYNQEERVRKENEAKEQYKKEQDYKKEQEAKAEAQRKHQEGVATAMGSQYADSQHKDTYSNSNTTQTNTFSYSETKREDIKNTIAEEQRRNLQENSGIPPQPKTETTYKPSSSPISSSTPYSSTPPSVKYQPQQMNFEVATIETVKGNKYIVPESQKVRFNELKAIYEEPGVTPPSVREEMRGFEQYRPEKYNNVSETNYSSYNTASPNNTHKSSEFTSPEKTSHQPSTQPPTYKNEPSFIPKDEPLSTFKNEDTPKHRQDVKGRNEPSPTPKTETQSTPKNVSNNNDGAKVILTVNGKGFAEVPSSYAPAMRNAINDTKTSVRGQTKTDEAVRILVSSGAITDDRIKTKENVCTTKNGLNAVAVARDVYKECVERNDEEKRIREWIGTSSADTDPRKLNRREIDFNDFVETKPPAPPTSQERRDIANKITVSSVINTVKQEDYSRKGLKNSVQERMDESYERNSKTEGKELKSTTSVVGQSDNHRIIGNLAGTQSGQQIKIKSNNALQPNGFRNATASFSQDQVPKTVKGNKTTASHITGQRQTKAAIDETERDSAIAPKQMQRLNASYLKMDWGKILETGGSEVMGLTEREMRKSQTFKGITTVADNAKAVVEVANLVTFGAVSRAVMSQNAADYITKGAKSTLLLKGNAKSADYISARAKARHSQHDLGKVNDVFKKYNDGKGFKINGELVQIDPSLGLSLKKGKPLFAGKGNKSALMLQDYCKKHDINLNELSDFDTAILINDLKKNKNSQKLVAALQQQKGIQGFGTFKGLRTLQNGAYTTDEIIKANKSMLAFIKTRTGQDVSGFSSLQLRKLAMQQKGEENEDIQTVLFALAGVKDTQASLRTATLSKSLSSVKRIFRRGVSSNESFAGYYQMTDFIRQMRSFQRNTSRVTSSIVRKLIAKRGKSLDKKIAKIQKKLKNGKGGTRRIRKLNDLLAKQDKFNKKVNTLKKVSDTTNRIVTAPKRAVKRVVNAPKTALKNAIAKTKVGKTLSGWRQAMRKGIGKVKTKLLNSKAGALLSKLFSFIGKIMKFLKMVILYILLAIAILLALILTTNMAMWLIGEVGNSIESLFGQQAFTEEAAGRALITLQEYDKALFASEDAITKKLQSTTLKTVIADNTNWFAKVFTDQDNIYGFMEPKDNTTDPVRFKIDYAGVPYNHSDTEGQFQQVYYDGWRAENDTKNIITRYSNAKDILCVANVAYGGEINKFWDGLTDVFGGGSADYCEQLWTNTHFCSICKNKINAGKDDEHGMCIHTTPLFACTKGDCDGKDGPNKYLYYCNYNDSNASDAQKKTFWLYTNDGSKWKMWDGSEVIQSTHLNDNDTFGEKVKVRLAALNPSIYGVHAEMKSGSDTAVTYSQVSTNIVQAGYSYPFTLYGKTMGSVSNYYEAFKDKAYIWPVMDNPYRTSDNQTLQSLYGARILTENSGVSIHTGIDIATGNGTAVFAVADGKVTKIFNTATDNTFKDLDSYVSSDGSGGYGNYVEIQHSGNLKTFYAHLGTVTNTLRVGSTVKKGDQIGTIGTTGKSSGYHLHFELKSKDKHIDPFILYGGFYGSPNGHGCVKNFCEKSDFKKVTVKYTTTRTTATASVGKTTNFSKDKDGNDLGYYKYKQTFGNNKDCTYSVTYCDGCKTVKHESDKKNASKCDNCYVYYKCNGHQGTHEEGRIDLRPEYRIMYTYMKIGENNYLETTCSNYKRRVGYFWDDNGNGVQDAGEPDAGLCAGKGKCEAYHFASEDPDQEGLSNRYYDWSWCPNKSIVKIECKGHKVCPGHLKCLGHDTCPGHNLAYCTGHTTLITETVIVGLNEYSGAKFETDVMANATWNKYASGGWPVDMGYSSSFSLKNNFKTQLAARNAYNEDWADLYDIEFYEENTPFQIQESETKSILLQQDKFSNRAASRLALLSVGRVGYHDTYSNSATYTKLDGDKTGTDYFVQYKQFAQDVSDSVGADSGGRIMSGLNNNTFIGYILWSSGARTTHDKASTIIGSMKSVTTTLADGSTTTSLNSIQSGDICSFVLKEGDVEKTKYGIVVTVNPTESDERGQSGLGTVGVVFASEAHSDAIYFILNETQFAETKAKFYTYSTPIVS